MRAALKEITERRLDALFHALQSGELHQSELPLAVEQFYQLGIIHGVTALQQQAREYEHKLDLLYLQAYSPKDRAEIYQRRLDQHFAQQDAIFFAEADTIDPASTERRAA